MMAEFPYDYLAGVAVFSVIFLAIRLSAEEIKGQVGSQAREAEDSYNELLRKKQEIDTEKNNFEAEAAEIFTLYDLTREITRNFSEEESRRIFQQKLAENVRCQECRFLDPESADVQTLGHDPEYHLVPLQVHQQRLGYLAVKGCGQEDQEKVAILAHQFALALQRDRLYREVEQLAITDSLTGAHTRRYILDRFSEELNRARARNIPIAFLMIDVDYFKHFNDQFGHLTGDQILRRTAEILQENIREIDILGRYGGEEFSVILPDTDLNGALYVAERMRSAIERTLIHVYDAKVYATISVGIAVCPKDGKKMSELIDKADWALYRAKKKGRNLVCAFSVYD